MLVNTKHIVMFDDAADDLGRIADMVDNDGAVLMLRDGQPAYVLVAFEDVEEAGGTLPGKKASSKDGAEKSGKHGGHGGYGGHDGKGKHKCTCGQNPGGYCEHDHGAGGKGCGGHGQGHGHGRSAGGEREGRRAGGPGANGKPWWFGAGAEGLSGEGSPLPFPPFGFGAWQPSDGDDEPTTPAPDAFAHGKPDFLPPELNDLVPPDVMEAGKNLLNGLMGFFGPPSPDVKKPNDEA